MADVVITNTITANIQSLLNGGLEKRIEKALDKACQIVENDAKRNCPVDLGILRASITHVVDGNKGTIGSTEEYATYVEMGTGIYAENGNGRETPWSYQTADGSWHSTEGQKAQPFLQPALDNNTEEIAKCLSEVFK